MSAIKVREAQNKQAASDEIDAWLEKNMPRLMRKALKHQAKGKPYEADIIMPFKFIDEDGKYAKLGLLREEFVTRATAFAREHDVVDAEISLWSSETLQFLNISLTT